MAAGTTPPSRGKLARLAAILLPIVVVLRAILLLFQLHSEHHPQAPVKLAWPPVAGERLSFEGGYAGIRHWAAQPDHVPISAALIEKNAMAMPPDTGCLLNPQAMAGFPGGTLTLVSQDPDGDWIALWSGQATMTSLADTGADTAANQGQPGMEAAMLDAADCGISARVSLTRPALHRLITIINDQPAPLPGTDPVPRLRTLKMRVQTPSAP